MPASLVPSRLSRMRPETSAGSSAFAPSSPCSSDTVKRSSRGPCAISGSSAAAIAAATPIPLSAPSVVPSASTQSPSRTTLIRPSRGSYGLDGSRSHTMSRCAWRTTVCAPSRPDEAGIWTTTFPAASTSDAKPRSPAQPNTCARAASSCFGGRGIRVSSRKCSQTRRGSSCVRPLVTAAASVRRRRRGARSPGGAATSPRSARPRTSRSGR